MPKMDQQPSHHLAFDMGASGGRAVLGTVTGGAAKTEEIHRFKTGFLEKEDGHVYWDVPRFWEEIKFAIREAGRKTDGVLDSIGIDTWAVDYVLLDQEDGLIGLPYAYRDKRNDGMMAKVFSIIPKETLYEKTGVQFLPFNTLFQLYAEKLSNDRLHRAAKLLFIPDYFNFLLTGEKVSEFTFATTTQFYNPRLKSWDFGLLDQLGISKELLNPIVPAGTVLGGLREDLRLEFGLRNSPKIIAPATHDTGSAIIGAPVPDPSLPWAYISSGTWSLMGIEVDDPVITRESLEFNFTNEGSYGGKFRFLKNIMGLWLLQRSEETWEKGGNKMTSDEIIAAARKAESFESLVYPNHPDFLMPPDMPEAIRNYCSSTGQTPPKSFGETANCIFLSLAMAYREVLEQIERVAKVKIGRINILGGGSKNDTLNQLTADVYGLEVVAGPSEATVLGNLIVQVAASRGEKSLSAAKAAFGSVSETKSYFPRKQKNHEELYRQFLNLKKYRN